MTAFLLLPLLLASTPPDTGRAAMVTPESCYAAKQPCSYAAKAADAWIGEDKFRHLALSYMVTATVAAGARTFTDRDDSIIAGAALGLLASVGKEIVDRKKGSWSVRDLLWDMAGITLAVLVEQQTRR
jgi:uncharacterized protein YfiM (DUF2279 family)